MRLGIKISFQPVYFYSKNLTPVPEGAPAEGAATEPGTPLLLEAPTCDDDPPDCKLDGTITTSLTEVAEAKEALLRKLSWMSDGL